MAKDTFYFSHDYNARNDPKILELRSEFGMEGVGIYWCLIETLAEDENGYIIASLMGGLSVGFGIPKARLIEVINFMVEIDLLCKDDTGIYSRRMMEHKKLRKTLSDKGKEGAIKRWGDSHPIAPPNAKERKKKESKVKERFIKPTIFEVNEYCFERNKGVDPNKFFDHYESNGWMVGKNKMKDWKAAVRNWEKSNFQNPINNGSPRETYTPKIPTIE